MIALSYCSVAVIDIYISVTCILIQRLKPATFAIKFAWVNTTPYSISEKRQN